MLSTVVPTVVVNTLPALETGAADRASVTVAAATLDDGRFIVVWDSRAGNGGDTSGWGVHAQLFAATGEKLGSEFLVNTSVADSQTLIDVWMLPGGGFAVAWTDQRTLQQVAQVFDYQGNRVGSEAGLSHRLSDVVPHPIEGNIGVLSAQRTGLANSDVHAVRLARNYFQSGDRALVSGFTGQINDSSDSKQGSSRIALLANENLVVTWTDPVPDGEELRSKSQAGDIKAQVVTLGGQQLGPEISVNANTDFVQDLPDVSPLAGGGFVVSWIDVVEFTPVIVSGNQGIQIDRAELKARIYSEAGQPLGGEITVATNASYERPALSPTASGGFVVAWLNLDDAAAGARSLRLKQFDGRGALIGSEHVEATVTSTSGLVLGDPILKDLTDGRLLLVWNFRESVVAKIFDPLAGSDVINGGASDEMLRGGDGDDTMLGAGGADFLDGDNGDDEVRAGEGGDFVRGLAGNDKIYGDAGDDDINGNLGSDTVQGGSGNDTVRGGQGDDVLYGDEGNDPHVNGNIGNDTVYGGSGNDVLFGGQNDDLLYGGEGLDVLSGDLGNDTLIGGAGPDRFIISPGRGRDVVLDFSFAEGDRVLLFANTSYAFGSDGGSAAIILADGAALVLAGVLAGTPTSQWIQFTTS